MGLIFANSCRKISIDILAQCFEYLHYPSFSKQNGASRDQRDHWKTSGHAQDITYEYRVSFGR